MYNNRNAKWKKKCIINKGNKRFEEKGIKDKIVIGKPSGELTFESLVRLSFIRFISHSKLEDNIGKFGCILVRIEFNTASSFSILSC